MNEGGEGGKVIGFGLGEKVVRWYGGGGGSNDGSGGRFRVRW